MARRRWPFFGRTEPVMRRVSPLPTLVTVGNLLFGFAAIAYSLQATPPETADWNVKPLVFGCYLLLGAMLCDLFDGRLARMMRATGRFGVEIDSLADIVSFCVAPAVMALALIRQTPLPAGIPPGLLWVLVMTFVACGALRLARYNVESLGHPDQATGYFKGLPTPGAAGLVIAAILLHNAVAPATAPAAAATADATAAAATTAGAEVALWIARLLPGLMCLAGLAMVSRIPYPHVGNRLLRGRRSFFQVVLLIFLLAVALWHLAYTLGLVFGGYFLCGPVGWLGLRTLNRYRRARGLPPLGVLEPLPEDELTEAEEGPDELEEEASATAELSGLPDAASADGEATAPTPDPLAPPDSLAPEPLAAPAPEPEADAAAARAADVPPGT